MDTSAGTDSPSSFAARMAPSASSSDMHSTAVGLGSSPSSHLAPSLPNSRTLPGASQTGTASGDDTVFSQGFQVSGNPVEGHPEVCLRQSFVD